MLNLLIKKKIELLLQFELFSVNSPGLNMSCVSYSEICLGMWELANDVSSSLICLCFVCSKQVYFREYENCIRKCFCSEMCKHISPNSYITEETVALTEAT